MVAVDGREAARRQPRLKRLRFGFGFGFRFGFGFGFGFGLERLRRVARQRGRVAPLCEREARRGGVSAVAHQLEGEPLDVGLRLRLRRHPVARAAANLKTVGTAARAERSRPCGHPRAVVLEERRQLEGPHPRRAGRAGREHAAQPEP